MATCSLELNTIQQAELIKFIDSQMQNYLSIIFNDGKKVGGSPRSRSRSPSPQADIYDSGIDGLLRAAEMLEKEGIRRETRDAITDPVEELRNSYSAHLGRELHKEGGTIEELYKKSKKKINIINAFAGIMTLTLIGYILFKSANIGSSLFKSYIEDNYPGLQSCYEKDTEQKVFLGMFLKRFGIGPAQETCIMIKNKYIKINKNTI